jgi:FtsP/CotA-like multicopper oxidase with cupredoxin domain
LPLAPTIEPFSPTIATAAPAPAGKPDYTLKIANGLVELSREHIVSTTLYKDAFPGPLFRFKEGQRVTVDIQNDTDTPELVHWHAPPLARWHRTCHMPGHMDFGFKNLLTYV